MPAMDRIAKDGLRYNNKLTIKVDRPQLSPEDIKKLEAAQRNNKVSE